MNSLVQIRYDNDIIIATRDVDGVPYVPLKQFCDRLGLAWQSQHRKVMAQESLWGVITVMIPSAGGEQETVCIPVSRVAAWLFSISPSRVKPELRAALEDYQIHCADVLDLYFNGGTWKEASAQREKIRHLQTEILVKRPRWSNIMRYLELGKNRTQIRYHLGLSHSEIFEALSGMAECGIVPYPKSEFEEIIENDPLLKAARVGNA